MFKEFSFEMGKYLTQQCLTQLQSKVKSLQRSPTVGDFYGTGIFNCVLLQQRHLTAQRKNPLLNIFHFRYWPKTYFMILILRSLPSKGAEQRTKKSQNDLRITLQNFFSKSRPIMKMNNGLPLCFTQEYLYGSTSKMTLVFDFWKFGVSLLFFFSI